MPEKEKRMAGEYQVFQTIHLGDKEIIMGEKPDAVAKDRYLCAFCEINDFFSLYTEGYTGEYLEIMQLFHKRVGLQIKQLKAEREKVTVSMTEITKDQCIPVQWSDSVEGKVVVIKASSLRREYRSVDQQLVYATGGFGAQANARGSAVFCTNLYSGKESRWERRDIEGMIRPDCIPDWAKLRLSEIQKSEQLREKNDRGDR